MPSRQADKGKAVDRSESTPLLSGQPSSSRVDDEQVDTARLPSRGRAATVPLWRHHIVTTLPVLFTAVLSCLLLLALLTWSFVPGRSEAAELARGVVWQGPERVDVINVTNEGIWIEMDGFVGVDADWMLGVGKQTAAQGERGGGAAWWESLRGYFGRWMVRQVGEMRVNIPDSVEVFASAPISTNHPIVTCDVTQSLPVPLTPSLRSAHPPIFPPHTDYPGVAAWLTPISVVVKVAPLARPEELLEFARQGWMRGKVGVDIRVKQVQVSAARASGWRKYVKSTQRDLVVPFEFDIARIPGLPAPGTDLASLIKLKSYSFRTATKDDTPPYKNGTRTLQVSAVATVPNLAQHMHFDFPYHLGFAIYLPSLGVEEPVADPQLVKMADVVTLPLSLKGQKDIAVHIEGTVVNDLAVGGAVTETDSVLSQFLRRYLRGADNQVLVRGLSKAPPTGDVPPPDWLLNFLPSVSLNVTFPGPSPPPKLIHSVTIEDMKISERGGKMTATGVVVAVVEVPKDMQGVSIQVIGVRPDVLIFDGDPPDDGDVDPATLPYPPKAFGRIHPDEYLPATSQVSPEDPKQLVVRAPIYNVPLDVLAGRDSVLSDFVGKIIFRGGALAGIKGKAGVQVRVSGVRSQVMVDEVPVTGAFVVGKPRR